MTTLNAVDSYAAPDPALLAQNGIQLASRYLSHTPAKDLTAAEAAALHAAGVGVLLNWESDSGRAILGAAAGAQDGADAAAMAESLGAPHGLTIFLSCDTDVGTAQLPAVLAYYQAAGQAMAGRYGCGAYGEAMVVNFLTANGAICSGWQTLAWSEGDLSPAADMYQFAIDQTLAGMSVDFNQLINPGHLGAWWPAGHDLEGSGNSLTAPPPSEEDDLNNDQLQAGLDQYFAGTGKDRVRQAIVAEASVIASAVWNCVVQNPTLGVAAATAAGFITNNFSLGRQILGQVTNLNTKASS